MEIKKPTISESRSSLENFVEINGISCKITISKNIIQIKNNVTHIFVFRIITIEIIYEISSD